MAKIMICKKNVNETKRFWRNQKRLLIIPLSEKQIETAFLIGRAVFLREAMRHA